MKLWQKIFLSSLALIIVAINVISITLLNNSHRLLLEREQTHAINEHEYFTASFSNAVIYAKLADDKISSRARGVHATQRYMTAPDASLP